MASPTPGAQSFAPLRDSRESKLFVNVMEARNLRPVDVTTGSASADPFVVVKVGPKILQTSVQRRNLNPMWNETFIIPGASLAELYQQTLEISVQDKSPASPGLVLGTLKVPLSRIAIGEEIDLWFELEGSEADARARGQLHMVLQLEGPFRVEFKALERLGSFLAGLTDRVLRVAYKGSSTAKPYIVNKYTGILAVPALIAAVAAAPLAAVALTLGFPLLLPLLLVGLLLVAAVLVLSLGLALGSQPSRARATKLMSPLLNRLRDTPVGQQMLYQTGPRPNLEAMLDTCVPPDEKWARLYMSLVIDAIGSSSYLLPVIGEAGDLAWAPIQAMLVGAMYRRSSKYIAYFSFVEEILPFTDIVPTATLGWIRMYGPEVVEEAKAAMAARRRGRVAGAPQPEITAAS